MHHIRQRLCLDQLFVSWKRQLLRFYMRQERPLCRTRSILSPTEILFARGTIHVGIGDVNCDSADQSKCLTDAKNTMRVNQSKGRSRWSGLNRRPSAYEALALPLSYTGTRKSNLFIRTATPSSQEVSEPGLVALDRPSHCHPARQCRRL